MSAFVQSKLLPSWYSIPSLALGVFQSNPGAEAYNAVLTALKLGYRHIDTATFYKNERDVGRAIRDSGISREEIFVTSKYFETSRWSYQRVAEGVRESNRKLGLGSIPTCSEREFYPCRGMECTRGHAGRRDRA
ncbi:hypothetical protein PC128_g22208 [Phytophthora cactorum]|nr:hypothetical protein PC128_g22208 [Phytophthora cactorum]